MADKTSDELAELVMERYGYASRNQQQIINEMEQCRLFYRGDQWLRRTNRQWTTAPPDEKWRVRLTVNKLPPLVELSIATYLRYRPIIICTPASDEDEDRQSAKIGQILLRYFWDLLKFDDLMQEALREVFVLNSSFLRVSWDPTKGRKIPVYKTEFHAGPGGVMVPVQTGAIETYKAEGAPCVDVISPFSMSIEPGALKFEDAGWCITTEFLRKDVIEQRFNTTIEEDKPATDEFAHIPVMLERDIMQNVKDRSALHIMYERPTKENEEGRILYVCNRKLLHKEILPKGEVRIVHLKGIPLVGEFWPTSMCSQVLPLQMELNRGRSQLIENRNLCSRPQWIAPDGAFVKGAVNNRPGKIVKWDHITAGGIEPHYVAPPQVPGWVMQILGIANDDMMDLASRHEASQGIEQGGGTSGRQTALFRSADDSRLAPGVRLFESGLREVGRFLLATAQENMKGVQVIPIVGRGRFGEVAKFHANDISDKSNITYEIASQLPWAREAMRQTIMELNRNGKLDDDTMFKLLELPTVQRLWEHEQEHRLNARNENTLLKTVAFPPLPTDNHKIHLQEHERIINLPENRAQFVAEMQYMQKMQQMQQVQFPGQPPQQQQQVQYPPSLKNNFDHMEQHRKLIPKPQPPPPAPKINLNIDRMLQNPLFQNNPALLQQVLPMVLEILRDTVGQESGPSNPPTGQPGGKPRAAGAPGGVTGGTLGGGPGPAVGMSPQETAMMGGGPGG